MKHFAILLIAVCCIAAIAYGQGLVAYYPFNGNANDASGNGNNGTVSSATLTTDRFGRTNTAYSFDGVNDYINCGNGSSFTFTTGFSVSVWFTFGIDPYSLSYSPMIIDKYYPTLKLCYANPSDNIYFETAGKYINSVRTSWSSNTWYHLVVTYDKSNMKIYINGALDYSYGWTSSITATSYPLYIGRAADFSGVYWNGKVDDIKVYNRAITSTEVLALYNESAIAAPTLRTPANNSYINNHTPTMVWGKVDSATSYRVQVSKDSLFTTLRINQTTSTVNDTSYTTSALGDSAYYWRVKAYKSTTDSSAWSTTWKYTIGQWETKRSMTNTRDGLIAVQVNGKVYAIGGYSNYAGYYTNKNEEYDASINIWTAKQDMPTSRNGIAAAAVNGRIYVIGGFNGTYLSTVEEYDPVGNSWVNKNSMPIARRYHAAAVVNNKIYVIGGSNGSNLDTVQEYNPQTNSWTPKRKMPTARYGLVAASVNNMVYAIGGYNGSFLQTVEQYDPSSDTWTTKTNMPLARNVMAASVIGNKIYVVGGNNGGVLGTMQIYDPAQDSWTTGISMPTPRYNLAAATIGAKFYAIGGNTGGGTYVATVEEYEEIITSVLTDPILMLPTNNSFLNTTTPNLFWGKVDSATSYRVQVSKDSLFTTLSINQTTSTGNDTSYTTPTLGDSTYFWRVKAYKSTTDSSAWSTVWSFRVDTRAPDAPTGILANGSNPSAWARNAGFTINLTSPSDPSGIGRYFFKLGTPPASNIDTNGSSATKPFTVNATAQGGQNVYIWCADSLGNVNYNNNASVMLRYDVTPPSGSVATSPNISTNPTFTVSWSPGSDNGGSGLTGKYWIKYQVNSTGWLSLDTNYTGLSRSYTGSQGNRYFFEVAAKDSAGNVEAFTGAAECSTLVDTNLVKLVYPPFNASINNPSPTLLWNRSDSTVNYRFQISPANDFTTPLANIIVADTSYAATSLVDSVYYWRVRAYKSGGDSSNWSSIWNFRIDTQKPGAPSNVTANGSNPSPWSNNGAFSINLTAPNDPSDISRYLCKTGNRPAGSYDTTSSAASKPFNVSDGTQGPLKLFIWLADGAGNVDHTDADSVTLRYDTGAPQTTILSHPWPIDTSSNVTLTYTGADSAGYTPVDSLIFSYRFDGGGWSGYGAATTALFNNLSEAQHTFEVKCRDLAGNEDGTPAAYTFNTAKALTVLDTRPLNDGRAVPACTIAVRFSKPVMAADLGGATILLTSKSVGILNSRLMYSSVGRMAQLVSDTCLPAADSVTVRFLGGIRDSLGLTTLDGDYSGQPQGSPADDYAFRFVTGMAGDYNLDNSIDAGDLTGFTTSWGAYERKYETGPYIGAWPNWRVVSGAKLDYEDVAGLVTAWNYVLPKGAISMPTKAQGSDDIAIETDNEKGIEMTVRLQNGRDFSGLDATVTFDNAKFRIEKIVPSELWQTQGRPQLFLTKQHGNTLHISAAKWPQAKGGGLELFRLVFSGDALPEDQVELSYRLLQGDAVLGSGSIKQTLLPVPAAYALNQAYPNPTRERATIKYALPQESNVRLEVYNVVGQKVATIIDTRQKAGYYKAAWNLRNQQQQLAANGVYLYRLSAGDFVMTKKLVIVR